MRAHKTFMDPLIFLSQSFQKQIHNFQLFVSLYTFILIWSIDIDDLKQTDKIGRCKLRFFFVFWSYELHKYNYKDKYNIVK